MFGISVRLTRLLTGTHGHLTWLGSGCLIAGIWLEDDSLRPPAMQMQDGFSLQQPGTASSAYRDTPTSNGSHLPLPSAICYRFQLSETMECSRINFVSKAEMTEADFFWIWKCEDKRKKRIVLQPGDGRIPICFLLLQFHSDPIFQESNQIWLKWTARHHDSAVVALAHNVLNSGLSHLAIYVQK